MNNSGKSCTVIKRDVGQVKVGDSYIILRDDETHYTIGRFLQNGTTDTNVVSKDSVAVKEFPMPTLYFEGPIAFHNQSCPIELGEHAIFDMHRGIFLPSRKAKRLGWNTIKATSWIQKLALRLFFSKQID